MRHSLLLCILAAMTGSLPAAAQDATKPVADLLDVQFNEDGSATDASAMQNTVEYVGTTCSTYYSDAFQRFVCNFQNTWATSPATGYYKVSYANNQDFYNALADGHTMEVLCMPKYSGGIANAEAKPFSGHQGGGTGLMICKTSGERQNELTFLPNVGGSYRWATSGIVPASGVYYHLIGVWDKEAGEARVYVNGELKNTVGDCGGDWKAPSSDSQWFAIGGDPAGASTCEASWVGDIVLARIYDKPLSNDEVSLLWNDVKTQEQSANMASFKTMVDEGQAYLASIVATQSIMDEYQAALTAMQEAINNGDVNAAATASDQATEILSRLGTSADSYTRLQTKVQTVIAYLDEHTELTGTERDNLYKYLTTEVAPGEEYAQGSFPYIWKTHTLTANEVSAQYDWIQQIYSDLEAQAATKPVADLLDVQFNEDGTATDNSARKMTIVATGGPAVAYSDAYQRYMATFDTTWGGSASSYFKVDFENDEAFRNALADGHSLEVLIMPGYAGTIPNSEAKPFSAMEGGGTGFLISTISGARKNEITYLPNVTTTGSSNWCWTTSGIVPEANVYYHVVGVWNKEEQKAYVYVNGQLMNTVDAVGEMHFANSGNNWFAIGGDPSGGSGCGNAWQGNVVLARAYDQPLNAAEVNLLWKDVQAETSAANNEHYLAQVEEGNNYLNNLVATQELMDSYQAALEEQTRIINGEEEGDAQAMYKEIQSLRTTLEASADAYAKYQEKIDYVKGYLEEHNDFAGDDRDYLETYLNDDMEPDDDYPNGSYSYIWQNHTMTTEEITAETEKVATMLSTAIENGYTPGTEITNLLANPTFEDGFSGWSGSLMTSSTKSTTNSMTGAEGWAKNFNMYQTLEGLENGVYVLTATAAYRPFNNAYSTYYRANIYVNDNKTFLPTVFETYLPKGEAVDGENCYLTQAGSDAATDLEILDAGELTGYAMHGCTSVANAANGGRAINTMLANVTDGKLTIGIANNNPKSTTDWVGVANLHLLYAGTLDQADHYLDEALACQVARANTIINIVPEMGETYAQNPNCHQTIKDQLQAAVNAVDGCTSAEQKYELIGTFTQLFDLFTEGCDAYVELLDETEYYASLAAERLEQGDIDNTQYEEISEVFNTVYTAYENGSYSTQEALDMTLLKSLSELLEGEFVTPVANMLDVVFNEDGSAYDASPLGKAIESVGTNKSTYYNEDYNRYVANFQSPWAGTSTGYYKVDFESDEAFRNALADGHTLEILVKPEYEGSIVNAEAKPFSAMEGGGTGFLVSTTSGTRQNELTFLPNVTTSGSSTWRWTTSGVVPQSGVYYHVVGVWNREEQKSYIYVNGQLMNTIEAPGEMHFANSGNNWFAIGGDPSGGSNCSPAWKGDIAIARVYDQPLDRRQAAYLYEHVTDGPTAIKGIADEAPATSTAGIYTINGIRVEKTQQGLYIINGKKILVK